MPNQTLYDNFSQVRQYIDQEKPDLSSYVTKTELANCSYVTTSELSSYLPLSGGEITGPLYNSYNTTNNALYGIKSYSHIVGGDPDKTSVTFIATQRKCGGAEGTTYMASFFTNSDGRSKFAHKSYTGTKSHIGGENDDAFMCFNAYGFKIAYSGVQGNSASTEYDIIHSGNIQSFIPVMDENIIPKENNTYILGDATYYYAKAYTNCVAGGTGIWMNINGNNRHYFGNSVLRCSTNNYATLGTSDYNWKATYTQSLYLDGNDLASTLNTTYSLGKWHVGTATTYTSSTVAYCIATVDTFELDSNNNPLVGTVVAFKVTEANTNVNGKAMTLNVNNTGDKQLYVNNGVRTATSHSWYYDMTSTNRWYYWMYDGTYWVWINVSAEDNTTYSSMTDAEAEAGTGTSGRLIKPVTLATYYTAKSCFSYDSSTGTLTITI